MRSSGICAASRDVVDELAVHVVDEALEVGLFFRRQVVARVACVLQLAGVQDDGLELCPLQQIAILCPLHDDADGADDGGVVGVDTITGGGDVVGAAGSDGLNGGNDFFVLLAADAEDFVVQLLRYGGATARRVDVKNDGFYVIVVAKLAELRSQGVRGEQNAAHLDNANGVAASHGTACRIRAADAANRGPGKQAKQRDHAKDGAADDGNPEARGTSTPRNRGGGGGAKPWGGLV